MEYLIRKKLTDIKIDSLSDMQNTIIQTRTTDPTTAIPNKLFLEKIPPLTNELEAADLIRSISKRKLILGVVDYDSDGLNSGAVIYKALKLLGYNIQVIPNKRVNGNGFNPWLVDRIKDIHDTTPIELIITADHGSPDNTAYGKLKEYGIKNILVTDHHEMPNGVPDNADVFVNPQQADDDPKGLCGTGVIFKVLSNLFLDNNLTSYIQNTLPHAAIATITDMMPLNIAYNRAIVRVGVNLLNCNRSVFWSEVLTSLGLTESILHDDLGMKIGPFINTGHRLGIEDIVLELLITEDTDRRTKLITDVNKHNNSRKNTTKNIAKKALNEIAEPIGDTITLIIDSNISVNGLIANRIGSAYNVPTVVFSHNGDKLVGSARTVIPSLSMFEIFNEMKFKDPKLLIKAGGHAGAVKAGGHAGAGGCSIRFKDYDKFKEVFNSVVSSMHTKVPPTIPKYDIDINPSNISFPLALAIDEIGPYGKDWEPVILRSKFKLGSVTLYDSVAKVILNTATSRHMTFIYYEGANTKEHLSSLHSNSTVDVLYKISLSKRNDKPMLYFNVVTIKEL